MTRKRTPEEIQELLKQYRERGTVTRRAFCEQHGLSTSMLDYYVQRQSKPPARLAQVRLAEDGSSTRFALVLGNGRRIECGEPGLKGLIRAAQEV